MPTGPKGGQRGSGRWTLHPGAQRAAVQTCRARHTLPTTLLDTCPSCSGLRTAAPGSEKAGTACLQPLCLQPALDAHTGSTLHTEAHLGRLSIPASARG